MRLSVIFSVLLALLPFSMVSAAELPLAAKRVDFERDVQPIFQKHCYGCHGSEKQKSDLRLDSREAILMGGENGPAIVVGKPDESILIKAVRHEGEIKMPKGEKNSEKLSPEKIEALSRWIEEGAVWPETLNAQRSTTNAQQKHWAYQPIAKPPLPKVRNAKWVKTPVDTFILTRLEKEKLAPSPEADRLALIRRVTFDLTGLPPTLEEVTAFLADQSPNAFETVVDRLLASPAYGERWGRHWLDVVRYGESHGYEQNHLRPTAWPYRDYVIRAFNEDKPYTQFIFEQIAGDTITPPDPNADAATGFLVAGVHDTVGNQTVAGTRQQRADDLDDIVATTGAAFLGLTTGCARCHDHKFDPISQRDYYALAAVFAGVKHAERPLRTPENEQRKLRAAEIREQIKLLQAELAQFEPLAFTGRTIIIDDEDAAQTTILKPKAGGPGVNPDGDERGYVNDAGSMDRLPNISRGRYSWWRSAAHTDVFSYEPRVAGKFRLWLSWGCSMPSHTRDAQYVLDRDGNLDTRDDQELLATLDQRLFSNGKGEVFNKPLWSGVFDAGVRELRETSRILLRGGATDAPTTTDVIVLQESVAPAEKMPRLRAPASPRLNVERFAPVEAKFVRFTILATATNDAPCIDELEIFTGGDQPRNAAPAGKITVSGTWPNDEKHKLDHLNDGRYGNSRSWISNEAGRGWVQVELLDKVTIDRIVWGRDREEKFQDRLATKYVIEVATEPNQWRVVARSDDRVPFGVVKARDAIYPLTDLPPDKGAPAAKLVAQNRALNDELKKLTASPQTAYIGAFEPAAPMYLLQRGDVMRQRDAVLPETIASLGTLRLLPDASEAQRRIALARWLGEPTNPLTARVLVNRVWQYHFGRGLVGTPSDFGKNGESPSHPELLDWLASEFVANGWRLKPLHKQIVMSATYRQSSAANPKGVANDAGNRLLWRAPLRRMEAETLRDSILAVSGTLDRRMGGPSFPLFKYRIVNIALYDPLEDQGQETWRRSVYATVARAYREELMASFDCPESAQRAPRRDVTTTPLQALNLLNGQFVVQQAKLFAQRIEREAGAQPDVQVELAFRLSFGRAPTTAEGKAARQLVASYGLPALCRALFNANEFLSF